MSKLRCRYLRFTKNKKKFPVFCYNIPLFTNGNFKIKETVKILDTDCNSMHAISVSAFSTYHRRCQDPNQGYRSIHQTEITKKKNFFTPAPFIALCNCIGHYVRERRKRENRARRENSWRRKFTFSYSFSSTMTVLQHCTPTQTSVPQSGLSPAPHAPNTASSGLMQLTWIRIQV